MSFIKFDGMKSKKPLIMPVFREEAPAVFRAAPRFAVVRLRLLELRPAVVFAFFAFAM
ncbi:hypothetical protein [Pseudorhodoplanes sp.]|uniref:hypothetical protein n=1 Tax=Pseudorhodoplanes sp. TaxID=1934341 RepID=UPI003D0B6131